MARVRVRQHVNPLSQKYLIPVIPPDWSKIYTNSNQPIHLDIGCARGQFLWEFAQLEPRWNYLGLEIRESLVEEANIIRDQLELTNLHYLFCNANTSIQPILASLPTGLLKRVSIQFPDPWFKKRHQKRRVVQPELVNNLADYLLAGTEIFIQSDIREVALEMCDRFSEHPAFHRTQNDWLTENPLPLSTEREQSTLERNEPVYRALFIKTSD
ncbi:MULTISPECIES: tRNA (guanosine(46)-N7)-methyltransferase TrmB [Planktothrix]|jgi:tRNA (guanine-N7-)-methyltransferase|uniref:tRNA (guanine-N(7)-)-methyltransferase n=2 Tax=Planktothrix TaxID=54304 RepID=A0A479ZSJ1_PLAAG|nr:MULTISPECIES: tRNA (guanosine(46)-N7)-methyltransferase TrmB [Planktothrix]CAD5926595.1 tRNA (guanine-N(7)-)-methyltransferase [Planktothrix rubescens]CAC5340544.1 tRNA (guanine-N(7)-)-methyltransferase [Planktothrix rubescens NIVA-CYA 18]CAD5940446.1 tRNA (guanine-N(7)-)-methyltransferase [Planktothrix rubescens NIVA-CYA 18]CAD5947881.1 tRNA (guanine-N(7)-)-methyltransferase [Planktothrix agardhii]CAH2572420.1 tRNA (guanine-N(7)-)-methyltransferase [Planktothrix rubescens]